MGLNKLIKREILITLLTVLVVSIGFIMFSYSVFKVDTKGETNTIEFGSISLKMCVNSLCDSEINNIDNVLGIKTVDGVTTHVPIYPEDDPSTDSDWEGMDSYTFTLTNNGTLPVYMSIILNKLDTTSITEDSVTYTTQADDDVIKVAIGESGSTPTIKLYSDTVDSNGDHIISKNIYLEPDATKTYNLYAWLKSDVASDTTGETAHNLSQGKLFVTGITVRGEYLPEAPTS